MNTTSGYAPVNGLEIYFEIHGSGKPLVLLHGGLGFTAMFSPIVPQLAESRRIVAMDLQGHGRTADIDRPLRFELMADDVAGVLQFLGIPNASIMGYSLGAGVALQTTIRHPEIVEKLIAASFPHKQSGWFPEILAAMAQMGPESANAMMQTPLYQQYAAVAPRPQDWRSLHDKLPKLLTQHYDWSADVAAIKTPTLLVFGDADSMPPAVMAEFFGLLGGGKRDAGWDGSGRPNARLAILPGRTHYDLLTSPALAALLSRFLAD
jgi:pimeloyl-ACP methyl ester carboxylesterase